MSDAIQPRKSALRESELTAGDHRQLALNALADAEEYVNGKGTALFNATALIAIAHVHSVLAASATGTPMDSSE